MPNREIPALCPSFYAQFHCIGPECSDNCCHGWPIEIDKAHYLRYKAEKDAAFAPVCAQTVRRIKKDASDRRYARFSLDSHGRCGFQDGDGGCKMLRLLGENALSTTCAVYPRRKAEFTPGKWELSLSLSCEEAVRTGVLRPQEISFRTETLLLSGDDPIFAMEPLGTGGKGRSAPPPPWAQALRTVCIRLMQSREWPVPERIMAIILLLRRLDKRCEEGQMEQIPQEIIRFLQAVEREDMSGFFQALEYHRDAHLAALQVPMGHLIGGRQEAVSKDFLEMLSPYCQRDASGVLYAGRQAAEALLERMVSFSDPFLAEHSVWVENYFVNDLFSTLFPFLHRAEGLSFEEHGLLLAHQYALLRCLVAPSRETGSPEDHFLRAVVHTARLSQHGDIAADVRKLSRTLKVAGAAHFVYLLR